MAIDWNGVLVSIVDDAGENYEKRVQRQILFAGLIGLGLIVAWRILK